MTPENVRFHAAGHLAAAVALVQSGNIDGAKTLCRIVRQYLDSPRVDNPPAFRETLDKAIADPGGEVSNIARLEEMFCHQDNARFEGAGLRFGKG
jgi:hypothetical protein